MASQNQRNLFFVVMFFIFIFVSSPGFASFTLSGSSYGEWVNPVLTNSGQYYSISNKDKNGGGKKTADFSWGLAADTPFNNKITYDGKNWNSEVGNPFLVGSMTYRNGSVYYGDIEKIDLGLSINFNDPFNNELDLVYNLDIINTPNTTYNPVADADYLSFGTDLNKVELWNNGVDTYWFQVLGFSSDNGNTLTTHFLAPEGQTLSSGLYGMVGVTSNPVNPSPVPLPGTLPLLGFGIVCLAGIKRNNWLS